MSANAIIQILLYLSLLSGLSVLTGHFIAGVFKDGIETPPSALGAVEKRLGSVLKIDFSEMNWAQYSWALLTFSFVGILFVYAVERLQNFLPLNSGSLGPVPPYLALNTAVSFATNTNWQAYAGEVTMSHFTQMTALTVQNFVSAATGIAVLMALIRGFRRTGSATIGNFWRDLSRAVVCVLLPLSIVLALFLVSQGSPQTFGQGIKAGLLEPGKLSGSQAITEQFLPLGPVASQVAIKQLGTNGGGFFNTNSSHPFENPTPLSNLAEMLAILLIPAALCHAFGALAGDRRQGWALYAAMVLLFVLFLIPSVYFEQQGNKRLAADLDQAASLWQSGGNMEGKEVRFGIAGSAIWATATAAASNGSVNSMHDSYSALGGMMPMALMQLGEVVFGGVGCGLYGMLAFAILTVFIAGLMIGRTPEYLGKKIEAYEMKLVSLIVLIPCALVLIGTALAASAASGQASISNPGPHGFSQLLYAYSSMGNNNGSAFAGLNAGIALHTVAGAAAMFISRFWLIIPTLALAGSLAAKKTAPVSAGTLRTHSPLFVGLLVMVVLVVGALSFMPAWALGPVAEYMQGF